MPAAVQVSVFAACSGAGGHVSWFWELVVSIFSWLRYFPHMAQMEVTISPGGFRVSVRGHALQQRKGIGLRSGIGLGRRH